MRNSKTSRDALASSKRRPTAARCTPPYFVAPSRGGGLILLVAASLLLWTCVDCSATYNYNYVYGTNPTAITTMDTVSTISILGGRVNDQFFLVQSTHGSNCSNPPAYATNQRTWMATLNSHASASFASAHLNAGSYYVCYRGAHRVNGTNVTHPTTFQTFRKFQALPYLVTVGGLVSTDLSDFSCCGPFVAGEQSNCTIHLRDALGNPTGSANSTACRLRLCPLIDGAGSSMGNYSAPTPLATPGYFLVTFTPTGAGCQATIGVKFDDKPIANKQAYFSVKAGEAASDMSTSHCLVLTNGTTQCSIQQRDAYLNIIKICTYNSDGGAPVCTTIN